MAYSKHIVVFLGLVLTLSLILAACGAGDDTPPAGEVTRLEVIATTTFVGDVLRQVSGDIPRVTVLLGPGQNPHSYQPSPQDMVRISEAELIFANGLGLEEFLPNLLDGAGNSQGLVELGVGIDPLVKDEADLQDRDHGPDDLGIDPHVWFDPTNLMVWADTIASALAEVDPENAGLYRENAAAYQVELAELDSWIREQVKSIPEQNRELVTDHTSLGYFADEYGFQQVGAVIPASTTEAETSGRQLSELMATIQEYDVKAIFVSRDIDPGLAEIVAEETGVDLVPLYFGSLTEGGPVDTYLAYMRYNVKAIVSALSE